MFISADHMDYVYSGRIDDSDPGAPVFIYAGSSVKICFYGSCVSAELSHVFGDWRYFFGYFIDGVHGKKELKREAGRQRFLLAEGLADTWHELILYKCQDPCHYITFHGIEIDSGGKTHAPAPLPQRRMEFYGDSITAGEAVGALAYMGVEDPECSGEFSDGWFSYSAMTARKLDADAHIIGISGIALMEGTGYFNDWHELGTQGMEECFSKLQCNRALGEMKEWDFSRYDPQVVVVAIGQNDANPLDIMSKDYHSPEGVRWRERYEKFVEKLLMLHPKSHVILTTTILQHDLGWDTAISEVFERLRFKKGIAGRLHRFFYSRTACGTYGHVRIPEAEEMAEELSAFIRKQLFF